MKIKIQLLQLLFELVIPLSKAVRSFDYEYLPHLDDESANVTSISSSKSLVGILATPSKYNGIFHKCRCNDSQAWDGSVCVDTPTKVAVFDREGRRITLVDTGHFEVVTVGEPQCPSGNTLATLDSSYDSVHQFSLLPSGHLYWHQREFQFYCIDHMQDGTGETRWLLAHVCLSPPSVPRCCPLGRALTDNLSCSGHTSQVLAPPIMVDGLQVQWPGESPSQVEDVICSLHQDLLTMNLTSSVAFLKYSPDIVSLVWSPLSSQWKEQENGYCVGVQEGREYYQVRVCRGNVLRSSQQLVCQGTCVRKCCTESKEMVGSKCTAITNSSTMWKPSFYNQDDLSSPTKVPPDDLSIITGIPSCPLLQLTPHISEEDSFYLLTDGYMYVPSYKDRYPTSNYCIDNFTGNDNVTRTQALMCFPEITSPVPLCDATKTYVYPVLLLVSSGFLGVTLVIYGSLPDLRNRLNGKCLISQVSALLVGYISMSIASIAQGKMSRSLCRIIASLMHLTFLAGFFWLNVMCFDIWRTLRKMRTVSGNVGWIRRRFLLYSLYSWGCPLLITILAVIIEELPESYNVIRPDFGTDFCWFIKKRPLWIYFYVYILVLVLANIVFFIMVAVILYRSQKDPALKRSREVNRERLWLCGKLFLVMGITWLAEVISWREGTCQAWIVTDLVNALQGFSIFLVFVCKRSILSKVRTRWSGRCGRSMATVKSPATSITYTSGKNSSRFSHTITSPGLHGRLSAAVPMTSLREGDPSPDTQDLRHHSQDSSTDSERENCEDKEGEASDGETTTTMTRKKSSSEDLAACEATPLTHAHNGSLPPDETNF